MSLDLHPFLSSFPIVLIVIVLLLSLVKLFVAPRWHEILEWCLTVNLLLAALFAGIAFISGYYAAGYVQLVPEDHVAEHVMYHHTIARLGLIVIVVTAVFRFVSLIATEQKRLWKNFELLFRFISFALLLYTGFLGGELVFVHHVGLQEKGGFVSVK